MENMSLSGGELHDDTYTGDPRRYRGTMTTTTTTNRNIY